MVNGEYDMVVACIVDCMSCERLEGRKRVELSRRSTVASEGGSAEPVRRRVSAGRGNTNNKT